MNYYKQGDAANAEQIKTAFEKLGYNDKGFTFAADDVLFFTADNKDIHVCPADGWLANIIKTHPDYKELELPKPHYDIANFQPKQWVLTRDTSEWDWELTMFAYLNSGGGSKFTCINGVTFKQCIPFNDDTKHLLGTTDMPSEEYINW